MIRNRPVSLALATLFLWQTGCSSWQEIQIGELPEQDRVRVTSVSTGSTEIREPRVESDSIKGTVGDRVYAIPLAGVETIETRKHSPSKTAILFGGAMVFTVAAVVAAPSIYYVGAHVISDANN